MRHKLKRVFTVFIVPHDEEELRSYKVPWWAFQILTVFIFVFAAGFVYLFISAGDLRDRTVELEDLLIEKRSQQEELQQEMSTQEEEFLEERRIREERVEEILEETEQIVAEIEEIRELRDTVYDKVDGLDPPENASVALESSSLPNERSQALSRGDYTSFRSSDINLESAENNILYIQSSLPLEKESTESLIEEIEEHNRRMRATPSIRPARGTITSGFGYRRDPITGRTSFHSGVDISNSHGTPVYATAYGRVSSAAYKGSYGNMLIINHGYGYQTCYAHLSRFVVSPNQQVSRGQLIGYMGSTGRVTGSHLHYEVRINGKAVNAANYF